MKNRAKNQSPPKKQLSRALAGQSQRMFWQAGLIAVAVLSSTIWWVLIAEANSSARRQAQLFASLLEPGTRGDFLASIDRLRQRNPDLLAVGIFGANGGLETLYPPDPTLRDACLQSINASDRTFRSTGFVASQNRRFVVATVPLHDRTGPNTLQVAIALAETDRQELWLASTGLASLVGMALFLPLYFRNRRWHKRNVIDALRAIGQNLGNPKRLEKRLAASPAMRWEETSAIANTLCNMAHELDHMLKKDHRSEANTKWEHDDRRQKLERKLRRAEDLALTDALTGLHNRAYLDNELESIADQQRTAHKNLAAVMIDVDNFKEYNDSQGHQAGDELLRFIGELLRGAFRGTDHPIRYGGDEFLVLLPDIDARQAGAVAERVIRLFGQYASRLAGGSALSLSAGIATLEEDWSQQGIDLLQRADEALYVSKYNGKNGVFSTSQAATQTCTPN